MLSLIEKLKKVKDFRQNRGKRHPLWMVLIVIVLGLMTGNLGYRRIGNFLRVYHSNLIELLKPVVARLPSYSTIRRVIMAIESQELIDIFNEWALWNYPKREQLDWLSVDGKSLRSTVVNCQDARQNFVRVVSLFSQTTGWVVRLGCFESKQSSEVHQVQELVRDSSLEGKVLTGDALHCNSPLTNVIIESQNNYLMALKKNPFKLYSQAEKLAEHQRCNSECVLKESSHGLKITRQISVFRNPQIDSKEWSHLQSIIQVKRSGFRDRKNYQETAYYVSSLSQDAQTFAEMIQGHWRIENQLHWVKDVVFKEDREPIRQFQAATNFSTLKTLALNLLKSLGFDSASSGQRGLANPRNQRFLISLDFP